MKFRNYIFILVLMFLTSVRTECFAQFLQDASNRPVTEKKYVNVSGSPYYNKDFIKGSVKVDNNIRYNKYYLRYDQVADQLLFKEKPSSDITMEFTGTVVEFKLPVAEADSVLFRRVITETSKADGFYEVIYDGRVSLLKRTKKSIIESASYNSANVERTVTTSVSYFILTADKKLLPVKNDRKSLIKGLSDHSKSVEEYIATRKPDLKDDMELKKLMLYYNSL